MKRKQSVEPDMYVVPHKLTKEESKEITKFFEEYKRNKELKKAKHKKAA